MAAASDGSPIQVQVSPDGMRAEVLATAPGCTVEQVLEALRQADVVVDDAVTQQVTQAVAAHVDPDDDDEAPAEPLIVLTGAPAVNGEHGKLEWADGCDPNREPAEDDQQVDFYNQSHFVMAKPEQVIARVIPPTEGEAGRDVRGNALPPRPGEPCNVAFDPATITVSDDGRCTARLAGVLHIDKQPVSINPVLNIDGYVDFSTGNIRFTGDVIVARGVRDRFNINASGDVETGELIEAASVTAGGDLRAKGGAALKDAGQLRAGRDLLARYLVGVDAMVGHDALIEREVINCRLEVGHMLDVSKGAIMGGECRVAGPVRAGVLGSPAGLATMLYLACHPRLEARLAQMERMLQEIALHPESRDLQARRPNLERQLHRTREKYQAIRSVDLAVREVIHADTRLVIGGWQLHFHRTVRGPIMIQWNAHQRLITRVDPGQPSHPISSLPGVVMQQIDNAPLARSA